MRFHKEQLCTADNILEIFFAGCPKEPKCPGCFNESLWDPNAGRELNPQEILAILSDYRGIASQVHILGGEPLGQPAEEMAEFLEGLVQMFPGIPRVFFTGEDEIPDPPGCTHVKTGAYMEGLGESEPTELGFRLGSKNQTLRRTLWGS
jgi:hypothetical protein